MHQWVHSKLQTILSWQRPRSLSPKSLSYRREEEFSLLESVEQSPVSSPSPENLREASLLSSPPSLSLNPTSLMQSDSLLSPPNQNLTPIPLPKVLEKQEQEENNYDIVEKFSRIKEEDSVVSPE